MAKKYYEVTVNLQDVHVLSDVSEQLPKAYLLVLLKTFQSTEENTVRDLAHKCRCDKSIVKAALKVCCEKKYCRKYKKVYI